MNIQAFYKALARVLSEKTETEIKVKEIAENDKNGRKLNMLVLRTYRR